MSGIGLVLSGLALVAFPGLLRPLGRRLSPRRWARLCAAALTSGAAVFEFGLILYAAPTVLSAVGVPALASACERMISGIAPGGTVAGWVAAGLALVAAGLGSASLARGHQIRRLARVEPWLGEHQVLGSHDLVTLATEEPMALSVKGNPGQVIVSSGLVAAIGPEELCAVIAHEVAHLDHAHERYLAMAGAVRGGLIFFPLARRSVATLVVALERWADEVAVAAIPDGRDRLHRALLSVTASMVGAELALFSGADTVVERLEALEAVQPSLKVGSLGLLYSPALAVGIAVAAGLGAWISNLQMLLQMAGRCPL